MLPILRYLNNISNRATGLYAPDSAVRATGLYAPDSAVYTLITFQIERPVFMLPILRYIP